MSMWYSWLIRDENEISIVIVSYILWLDTLWQKVLEPPFHQFLIHRLETHYLPE